MFKPELLAPAGAREKLELALAYGADAVYMAGKSFGLRAGAGNFADAELEDAIKLCHERGARCYLTLNTVARGYELDALGDFAAYAADCGADAAIISDLGVFSVVKRRAPSLELHVSTQAGVTNRESASMWHDLGAKRVILARELSLDEIVDIRVGTPKALDLETFVHGAMCVSFSGRCLLSNYLTGRDANRGECAQPCRWSYRIAEEKNPGEFFPIEEHAEGAYILNSKDLCAVRLLSDIVAAGVTSLKIEGRSKSAYYAAAVTSAYRDAINDFVSGKPFDEKWYAELDKVSHRPYCEGFFNGTPDEPIQYFKSSAYIRDWDVCAIVTEVDENGATVSLKNPFSVGESLELMTPGAEVATVTVTEILCLDENGEAESVPRAYKNQSIHRIKLSDDSPSSSELTVKKYSILRKRG